MHSIVKEATEDQLRIAKKYGIPKSQAHTVNVEKAKKYWEWLRTGGQIDQYLDKLEESRGTL